MVVILRYCPVAPLFIKIDKFNEKSASIAFWNYFVQKMTELKYTLSTQQCIDYILTLYITVSCGQQHYCNEVNKGQVTGNSYESTDDQGDIYGIDSMLDIAFQHRINLLELYKKFGGRYQIQSRIIQPYQVAVASSLTLVAQNIFNLQQYYQRLRWPTLALWIEDSWGF
ncbi:Hypothetical_protein [Hexamita inflata]|uniref:Hypothetical_protein n=1 Tax=Hexamita inflata TaxID=28002 RepID=A0AA86V186_9EUKA|nr:Hypothetical protein HINF_LOCUS42123 [Hexamita inflata]